MKGLHTHKHIENIEKSNAAIKPADRALYGWDSNPLVWVIEFERIRKEATCGLDTTLHQHACRA